MSKNIAPADERAACQAAPADPRDITADTGHPEADWIIRRLTSDDPDFSDCAYAAWLIRKLARAQHEAAQAHKRCVGWAILNGVCVVDFSRDGAQARSMAREMQRSHDLSGSLAAFHVEPVFIVTGGADAAQPEPPAADERAAFESLKGAWQSMPPFDVFCAGWRAARAASANETGAEGAPLTMALNPNVPPLTMTLGPAQAAKPVAIPDEWRLVRVNEHFDALIIALERAEAKGYLPDAVREVWEEFACDENVEDLVRAAAPPAAPADERAMFEAAYCGVVPRSKMDLRRRADGSYVHDVQNTAWRIWQKARATTPARSPGAWPTDAMNRAGLRALAEFHHTQGDAVDAVFLAMCAAAPQPAQADAPAVTYEAVEAAAKAIGLHMAAFDHTEGNDLLDLVRAFMPATGAFEVTEEVAAEWAKRHDIEHVLKCYSTQRNAIEDARTLHLITQ